MLLTVVCSGSEQHVVVQLLHTDGVDLAVGGRQLKVQT